MLITAWASFYQSVVLKRPKDAQTPIVVKIMSFSSANTILTSCPCNQQYTEIHSPSNNIENCNENP